MKYFVLFALLCSGLAAVTGLLFPDLMYLFRETGPFETVGMLALVAAAVVLLWHVPFLPALAPMIVCLLLAERELDELHGDSNLRTVLIWIEDHILHNQTAVLMLAGLLLFLFFAFTVPYVRGRPIRSSLQVRLLGVGVFFAVLGQLGEHMVNDFVANPSDGLIRAMLGVEEVSEAFFSVSILCATVVAVVRSRRLRKDALHHS